MVAAALPTLLHFSIIMQMYVRDNCQYQKRFADKMFPDLGGFAKNVVERHFNLFALNIQAAAFHPFGLSMAI